MTQITIQVRNAKLVANNLQNLRADVPRIAKRNIEGVVKRVVKQMQNYPPTRPGQKYKRTYRFKNSWVITPMTTGYKVGNTASRRGVRYADYVVGDAAGKNQAWMHVGRWLLFRDVLDYKMTKLPNTVENHLRLKSKELGLS